MLPDYSVNHVPGLYPSSSNTRWKKVCTWSRTNAANNGQFGLDEAGELSILVTGGASFSMPGFSRG